MNQILEIGQEITLENQEKYYIAEIIDNDVHEYLMLLPIENDQLLENARYVKLLGTKNDYKIADIEDPKEKKEIIDIFLPLFLEDYGK